MLENIKDNSIVIVPASVKNSLLKDLSRSSSLLNIKIITREEFLERSTFSYDVDAILFLMDKYKYDLNVCKIYLDNMKYVEYDNYDCNKLNDLYVLKKELLDYYKSKCGSLEEGLFQANSEIRRSTTKLEENEKLKEQIKDLLG